MGRFVWMETKIGDRRWFGCSTGRLQNCWPENRFANAMIVGRKVALHRPVCSRQKAISDPQLNISRLAPRIDPDHRVVEEPLTWTGIIQTDHFVLLESLIRLAIVGPFRSLFGSDLMRSGHRGVLDKKKMVLGFWCSRLCEWNRLCFGSKGIKKSYLLVTGNCIGQRLVSKQQSCLCDLRRLSYFD